VNAAVDRWAWQSKSASYLLATHGETGIDGIPSAQTLSLRAQDEHDGAARGVQVARSLV
jgi:hypothetical protein